MINAIAPYVGGFILIVCVIFTILYSFIPSDDELKNVIKFKSKPRPTNDTGSCLNCRGFVQEIVSNDDLFKVDHHCIKPGRKHVSNLKSFPFIAKQKCFLPSKKHGLGAKVASKFKEYFA